MKPAKAPMAHKGLWLTWIITPTAISLFAYLTSSAWINALRGDEEPGIFDGLALILPLFFAVLPIVSLILLATYLSKTAREESIRQLFRRLGGGILLQALGIDFVLFARLLWGSRLEDLEKLGSVAFQLFVLGALIFFLPLILSQVLFSVLFIALYRWKKYSRTVSMIISFLVVIGSAIAFQQYMRIHTEHQVAASKIKLKKDFETRLLNLNEYRKNAREQTRIGTAAMRPYRIFSHKDGSLFTVDAKGVEAPLAWNLPNRAIGPNVATELYIDAYNDHVFYRTADKGVAMLDLKTNQSHPILGDLSSFVTKPTCTNFGCTNFPTLAGADSHRIVMERTGFAGATNIGAFDIDTGERKIISTFVGYDSRRVYQFWIDGHGYRLILDAYAEPEYEPPKPIPPPNVRLYLESVSGSPQEVSDEDLAPPKNPESYAASTQDFRWWRVFDYGTFPEFIKTKTPFFNFTPTDIPEMKNTVVVRNLYGLDATHAGLEINNELVVIDLLSQYAETISDPKEIEKRLAEAILIASDDEYQLRSCPQPEDTQQRTNTDHVRLEGCIF